MLTTLAAPAQPLSDTLTTYLRTLPPAARVSLAVDELPTTTPANVAATDVAATEVAATNVVATTFRHRANEAVPAASLIKLPILVVAMERVQAGLLDPDEIHILTDSEKAGGSGVLQTYSHRSRIAYRDLMTLMMTVSDNTATNILINEIGRDLINERFRAWGLRHTRLNRVMMDTAAVRQGRENYVSAGELTELLANLYRHKLPHVMASTTLPGGVPSAGQLSEQMLDILKRNDDTLTIPRGLPPNVVVAHKTGTLPYVRGDAGLVYARRPFALAVIVQGVPTPDAERIIADLARICYTWFTN